MKHWCWVTWSITLRSQHWSLSHQLHFMTHLMNVNLLMNFMCFSLYSFQLDLPDDPEEPWEVRDHWDYFQYQLNRSSNSKKEVSHPNLWGYLFIFIYIRYMWLTHHLDKYQSWLFHRVVPLQPGSVWPLCEYLGPQPGRAGLWGRRGSAGVQAGGWRARPGYPTEGLQPQAAGEETPMSGHCWWTDKILLDHNSWPSWKSQHHTTQHNVLIQLATASAPVICFWWHEHEKQWNNNNFIL